LDLPGEVDPEQLYGEGARPVLCFVVQTAMLLGGWLIPAVVASLSERYILPWTLTAEPWMVVIGFVLLMEVWMIFKLVLLISLKWILIGRYRPGTYPIYGSYYLRHFIVEKFSKGTPVGKNDGAAQGWAFDIGGNFLKNLALKALGADVALSATITAEVVGYDCVSVGPLASVHGPYHFTAVSYKGKQMIVSKLSVGAGAHLGQQSCMGANSTLEPGAYVEPLSAVPAGAVVAGRWTGVPAQQIASADGDRVPKPGDGRWLVAAGSATFLFSQVFNGLMKHVSQILSLITLRYIMPLVVARFDGSSIEEEAKRTDVFEALPTFMMEYLWAVPLFTLVSSAVAVMMDLFVVAAVCSLLPRVSVPSDLPLYGIRAQIAALKMRMVCKASAHLGDASIQAWFLGLCGAKIGHGTSMAEQLMLPETVEVGRNNFWASGNTLTSVEVDQGRFKVPSKTVLDDDVFLGNSNHIVEGLPSTTFAGLHTWVPKRPWKSDDASVAFFGNPAMRFARAASEGNAGLLDGTCLQLFHYHFSTTVIDLFFWPALQACLQTLPIVLVRYLFPSSLEHPWQLLVEVAIFSVNTLLWWYLINVRFCNWIYNDRLPLENEFFSRPVMRWFNANKARKTFQTPFKAAGVIAWHSRMMRLHGTQVGSRFFSPNEDVMIDAPFGRLGDDVTIDYDAQVRQHSFEDNLLKWGPYWIGNGTTLLQGACVAMSETGEYTELRPGSVTWKGQKLDSHQIYEGAPAAPIGPASV